MGRALLFLKIMFIFTRLMSALGVRGGVLLSEIDIIEIFS